MSRLRQTWPQVRIVFRGDSGFCRQRIINYCERAGVNYIIGLARNERLQGITEFMELAMKDSYTTTGLKQREVGKFVYAAQRSWAKERRVITRLEYGGQGNNPRYVVTNLTGKPQALYDDLHCQRGEAENRIKEAQVGLFATRTSCQHFQSNQLRMLLAALGYVLIERLRALALAGTALAKAQVDTLRCKLLKLAAVVTRNTRRIRLYLASNWPSADLFAHAMSPLRSPQSNPQRLAGALTQKWPATQAGVGEVTPGIRQKHQPVPRRYAPASGGLNPREKLQFWSALGKSVKYAG